MKATELIKRLQELVDEYGDHDVYHVDEYDQWRQVKSANQDVEEDAFILEELPLIQ